MTSKTPEFDALSKNERHFSQAETMYWIDQYKTFGKSMERQLIAAKADYENNLKYLEHLRDSHEALRAELAAIKSQKPAGWRYSINGMWDGWSEEKPPEDAYDEGSLQPLYTNPRPAVADWRPISEAPKDGTPIIAYREDAGVFLARYTSPQNFCTEAELEEMGHESAEQEDWFCGDDRLEGTEIPTLWRSMPAAPLPPDEKGP